MEVHGNLFSEKINLVAPMLQALGLVKRSPLLLKH
jgi:hypothetical protein